MDGQIIVDTSVILSQADEVSNLISAVSKDFESLKNIVSRTSAYWIGEAGNAHRDKYISHQPKIEEAIKFLKSNVNNLRTIAGGYSTAEQAAENEADNLVESVID